MFNFLKRKNKLSTIIKFKKKDYPIEFKLLELIENDYHTRFFDNYLNRMLNVTIKNKLSINAWIKIFDLLKTKFDLYNVEHLFGFELTHSTPTAGNPINNFIQYLGNLNV